jgi:tRNA threonylcarbamoyladenosine biosynthesis protein TsaB
MTTTSPRILVIDTSGPQASVEAWAGSSRLAREQFGAARHVQGLSAQLKGLLANVEWPLAEIEAIAVNIGPGSFTGIRVGLATAKALAYVDGQKIIGVDSFDAWAAGVLCDQTPMVDVVIGGQLNSVHVVRFEHENGEWTRRSLRTIPRERLAVELDPDVAVTGPSVTLIQQYAKDAQWLAAEPSVAAIAISRFAAGRFDDPWTIEPYYVRPSSAEEKWDARQST